MNKILDKKQNISSVIQAENQFIPSNILFQVALKNKFKIYARDGAPKKVTIREFKNYLEIFTGRGEPSLNFFKFIEKNYYKKAVKEGSKIVKDRFLGKKDKAFLRESNLTFSSKTHYSKSAICNKYKWEKKKKIVFIFSHTFIDGNFVLGWRLFKDNYTWLEETLKHIGNNKKVNWLIKPHPMDYHYKKVLKFDTTDLINKFTKKYNHIKICPSDMSMTTIKNLATSIVTSHGTAALEFGSFRVPVIMAARSQFSKPVFNFRHDKSKKNYFFKLDNIDRLKKLSIIISNKAKIDTQIHAIVENYKPERIDPVDRAILRLGTAEILYKDETPTPVAINEAIEIAQIFSSSDSSKFINGVLDKIAKTNV